VAVVFDFNGNPGGVGRELQARIQTRRRGDGNFLSLSIDPDERTRRIAVAGARDVDERPVPRDVSNSATPVGKVRT
jgi:hypothetical protein